MTPIIVTAFADIRVAPDTCAILDKEHPGWLGRMDRRSSAYKRWRVVEMDIAALAEAMWLTGDELTEI